MERIAEQTNTKGSNIRDFIKNIANNLGISLDQEKYPEFESIQAGFFRGMIDKGNGISMRESYGHFYKVNNREITEEAFYKIRKMINNDRIRQEIPAVDDQSSTDIYVYASAINDKHLLKSINNFLQKPDIYVKNAA